MHQMMGNLFFRRVPISDIERMDYGDLEYWNHWHELMEKAEKDAAKRAK